jgi:hypothetical protein
MPLSKLNFKIEFTGTLEELGAAIVNKLANIKNYQRQSKAQTQGSLES